MTREDIIRVEGISHVAYKGVTAIYTRTLNET